VTDVAVDTGNDELFVTNDVAPPSITVYSRTASGNTPPIRTITGAATRLRNPGMSAAQEHRAIAGREAAKRVAGGIAERIGFSLDDAPAHARSSNFTHHDFADEKSRQRNRVDRELRATQSTHAP
jgi:hypothetical protein